LFHGAGAPRADGLIGHEVPEILGQVGRRLVTAIGLAGNGLEHDGFQIARQPRVDLARRGRLALRNLVQEFAAVGLRERCAESEQFVKRDSQPVDVPAGIGVTLEALGRRIAERADEEAAAG
jgi:hypothetical protein